MRQLVLVVLLVLTLAGCAGLGTPTASNGGAEGVARQWVEAFNKGDAVNVMGLLAPDATLIPLNSTRIYTGETVLRDLFQTDFAYGVQIRLDKVQVNGDTVVADATLWSAKKGAMPETPVQYTWTVKGNKIATMAIKYRQPS